MPDEREQGVGLGRAGYELHLPVEEHDTGSDRWPSADGPVQQDGLPQRVRDVRGEAADELGLARGEAELAVLAVQAQVAPAVAAGDQRGAQLVAEPDRTHDVAVAGARHPLGSRRGVERTDVPRASAPGSEKVLTSWPPSSLSRNRGAMAASGSSLSAPVNSSVSGSAVAKNAASIDIALRSDASTCRCSSSTSSPLRQTRITARSALAVSGMAAVSRRPVRRGNPTLLGWSRGVAQGRPFSA